MTIRMTKLETNITFQIMAIQSDAGLPPLLRLLVRPKDKPVIAGANTKISNTHPSIVSPSLVLAIPAIAPLKRQLIPTVDHTARTYEPTIIFFCLGLRPPSALATHVGQK